MQKRKCHGFVHVILLAVFILVALSVLARCDIEAQATGLTPPQEQHYELDPNRCRCGNNPAGADALRRGV